MEPKNSVKSENVRHQKAVEQLLDLIAQLIAKEHLKRCSGGHDSWQKTVVKPRKKA